MHEQESGRLGVTACFTSVYPKRSNNLIASCHAKPMGNSSLEKVSTHPHTERRSTAAAHPIPSQARSVRAKLPYG